MAKALSSITHNMIYEPKQISIALLRVSKNFRKFQATIRIDISCPRALLTAVALWHDITIGIAFGFRLATRGGTPQQIQATSRHVAYE